MVGRDQRLWSEDIKGHVQKRSMIMIVRKQGS